ncbi:DUF1573 domain-containing protein [uncultured Microscilla sp.]|uniref:DUF1573 domain-containing protein n=1 Tax=uncultured Microscilla sp. TaxID=432653 RepID=UPI0026183966|nr:DUF1573 domain-containing protein [uncultured Microscilla sp.]
MKTIITLLLGWVALLITPGYGQQLIPNTGKKVMPSLRFERNEHVFGKIQEVDGTVSTTFKFTNQSDTILHIAGTWVGCGCTVPKIERKALPPGASSHLTVKYDPTGRAGKFRKKIRVLGKNIKGKSEVYITGEVMPHPYPIIAGGLRWKTTLFDFGLLNHTQSDTTWLPIININQKPIQVDKKNIQLSQGATLLVPFDSLAPKTPARIGLVWNAPLADQWGFIYHKFTLPIIQGKSKKDSVYLVMTAHVKEDFTKALLSGKRAQVALQQDSITLGKVMAGKIKVSRFQLTNTGNDVLHLRQVKTSCKCLKAIPESHTLMPGSSTHLRVEYQPLPQQTGKQTMVVMLTVNDPDRPQVRLEVGANVKTKTK